MLTGNELGAAIEQARVKKGVSKKALADAMGVKPASVQDWVKYGRIAKERINDLVLYFSDVVGPDHWGLDFTTSAGPGTKPSTRAPTPPTPDHHNEGGHGSDLPHPSDLEFALVPQLDIAAACGDGRFQDHVVVKGGLAFKRSSLRDFGVPENAARIIYADGGSMRPTIQDGRVVLINTADTTPKDGKIYAICLPDGGLVLKRLVYDYHPNSGGMVWIIRSDNPDKTVFPDKLLPPDDRTMIAGRAVWTDSVL